MTRVTSLLVCLTVILTGLLYYASEGAAQDPAEEGKAGYQAPNRLLDDHGMGQAASCGYENQRDCSVASSIVFGEIAGQFSDSRQLRS